VAPEFRASDQDKLNGRSLKPLIDRLFQPPNDMRTAQEQRIGELLALAEQVPFYRRTFVSAGISVRDFKCLNDISRFPVISKHQLIDAGRDSLHPKRLNSFSYETWSSGSSGSTLAVKFNPDAVIEDTLQGARQLILQSSESVGADSLIAHYYTDPWYTDNIGGGWRSAFISSLVPASGAADKLREWRPTVLAGYPSLLEPLAKKLERGELPLRLVITNSEQSTRLLRDKLAEKFSCPVLDEYSSEELTRIAVELPDKRYYVCEDSVFLEILHPETREPVPDGEWGEAVVTSLLNEAMPFIRYATGDLVKRPKVAGPPWKGIGWSQIEAIGGRMLDSFVRPDGEIVPSGAMLDVIYRAFCDVGVCIDRFELIQLSTSEARLNVVPSRAARAETVEAFIRRVEELLAFVLDTRVKLIADTQPPAGAPAGKEKRRPIRRAFAAGVARSGL
jgi:phenylacetate-CoA ligase